MKIVLDWVWNGPWWTPLVAAIYLSVLISIALAPVLSVLKRRRGLGE